MRYSALILSALVLSAGVSRAQTGFSTQTYPAVLPATSDNVHVLTADLNGDGRPDLVTYGSRLNVTAPINVFINNGSGGFLPPVAIAGSSTAAAVQIGDMNGDGYPDIVACQNIGSAQTQQVSVTVYLNNGNGTFKALPSASNNGQCNALTLGDVNHKGHLDVVTAGYTAGQYGPGGNFYPGNTTYIDVFSNDGTGKVAGNEFGGASLDDPATGSQYTNCGAIDVVGGDFAQDGNFDLVVTSACQPSGQKPSSNVGTTFYLSQTADSYGNESYVTLKHLQSAPEIYTNGKAVDVNGDGKLDVLFSGVVDPYAGDLTYLQNTGNGSFAFSRQMGAAYLYGAAVADYNGDGVKDIATSYVDNTSSVGPAGPPFLTILNGPAFNDSQDFQTGATTNLAGDVVSADFNGDGKPDLATLVYDKNTRTTSLNIYTNTQSGSSTACGAPTTANTNKICSPASGSTLNSPVTVSAASNVAGFTLNRLYLDNTSVYQTNSQVVSTPINATTGNHTLVLVSYNNKGQPFTSSTSFTIGTATGNGCIPTGPGVSICSPSNNSTSNPPLTITAGALAQSGYITAMRVYVDNNADFTIYNHAPTSSFSFNQGGLDFGQGPHHLVVVAYESTGGALTSSINFSEPTGPCTPPAGGTGLRICTPLSQGTINSPVTVSAGANAAGDYIVAIRAYVDNNPVALYTNSQKAATFLVNQPLSIASGKHYFVLVGYPSKGGSISAGEYITVK